MLENINPELIYLNFLDRWTAVDPETIQIDCSRFQNIPDDYFATFLIKDKNGNKGIALLPAKIVKEMNTRQLLNYSNEFSPKFFGRYQDKMTKRYNRNISKRSTGFLKSVCPNTPLCIAFGKEKEKIMKHFNGFKDFKYSSSVMSIGAKSKNGFARLIKYERDGYEASAVLKSSYKEDSDNLLFEYLVGQYINKQCFVFPCFIETYEWYQYKTEEDWKTMQSIRSSDNKILKSLVHGKVALQNYISLQDSNICFENKKDQSSKRKCTEIESLLKLGCAKSKYLSVLTQHIKYPSNIELMMHNVTDFVKNDLLNVLYQVYMPLATLFDTFTHYDLHLGNLIIYEPDTEKYIDYKYVMKDGTLVMFKSRYMAKIIDYGRCFFEDKSNKEISGSSKSIYKIICENIQECNGGGFPPTYCGEDQGFSNFDTSKYGLGYYINSSVSNMTHDLKLLYRVKKELKDELPDRLIDPLLQTIFDKLEYGNELKLEAEQIRTGKKIYEHGSEEKPTTGKLIDGIPDKINNVIDAHNALKTQILKNKEANDALYETMTSLGELTIYESGKPMEFKQIIRGLII